MQSQEAQNVTDLSVVQYLLDVEQFQLAFYEQTHNITGPSNEATNPGYDQALHYMEQDARNNVAFLSEYMRSLGGSSEQMNASYTFELANALSFSSLASKLEGVVASAFLASIFYQPSLSTSGIISAILVTHSANFGVHRFVAGQVPSPQQFGVGLLPLAVYSIIDQYKTPGSSVSPALSFFGSFPPLYARTNRLYKLGQNLTLQSSITLPSEQGLFLTFLYNINATSIPAAVVQTRPGNKRDGPLSTDQEIIANIPEDLPGGQTYVFVTNQSVTYPPDLYIKSGPILAGPAVIEVIPSPVANTPEKL